MAKRNPFVRGLEDRFRQATLDERGLVEDYERLSRALADLRETKKLCAALLRKEGVDPDTIEVGIDPAVARAMHDQEKVQTASNGQSGPLNATHAVYLVMRKHDNSGLMPEEVVTGSVEMGMKLSYQEVNKVIWTQTMKKRMEKLEDGRVRLTPEGETFNNFRRKAEGEYKPMIQNFPTQVIK
jgi:hypothetical protein